MSNKAKIMHLRREIFQQDLLIKETMQDRAKNLNLLAELQAKEKPICTKKFWQKIEENINLKK